MMGSNCEKCKFKGIYDKNPASFLGRLWRWHINFCPGWNAYMKSLSPDEKSRLAEQYDIKKYQ